MMAPALLGLAGADKLGHGLEYFIHSSHVLVQEVVVVDL